MLNSKAGMSAAQMAFSKYVFPEFFNENINKFRGFYKEKIETIDNKNFDFDTYLKKTDEFYTKIINQTEWKKYDLIGFSLNYSQFLPSLAVAKKIKEVYPNKKIVLGGSRTVGKIGENVLKAFSYIDYIVSGDGEEALFQLSINEDVEKIPNLIYRKDKEIICNNQISNLDLNKLPIIDFNSFYEQLQNTSSEIKQHYHVYNRMPIEISRGCFWNKCTFCNLNVQYKNYREKTIEKIIQELNFLSDTYKILKFQIIGNTLPLNNYRELLREIIKIDKDFSFIAENRGGRLKKEDYKLLKKAGFTTIQTGIESFSANYLKKMKKGVKVIDNIASLKFCKENGIINKYNIIYGYPNEEKIDFEESKKNISLIMHYIDPPDLAKLVVGFGSSIFENPSEYNIKNLDYLDSDKLMFPFDILDKKISFFYSFDKKQDDIDNRWVSLIDFWRDERIKRAAEEIKNKNLIDKYIFYFVDGRDILKVYDKRDIKNVKVYMLDNIERRIFLSCIDVISYEELEGKFPNLKKEKLENILTVFEKTGLIFKEKNRFLALPLSIRDKNNVIYEENNEENIIYNNFQI